MHNRRTYSQLLGRRQSTTISTGVFKSEDQRDNYVKEEEEEEEEDQLPSTPPSARIVKQKTPANKPKSGPTTAPTPSPVRSTPVGSFKGTTIKNTHTKSRNTPNSQDLCKRQAISSKSTSINMSDDPSTFCCVTLLCSRHKFLNTFALFQLKSVTIHSIPTSTIHF